MATSLYNDQGKLLDYHGEQFKKYRLSTIREDGIDDLQEFLNAQDYKWQEGKTGNEDEIDYNLRRSDITWVNDPGIMDFVWQRFKSANEDPDWDFDINNMEEIQYAKYNVSPTPNDSNPVMTLNGHYGWHTDEVFHENPLGHKDGNNQICRKLSMTINLNDDYKGASFEFGFLNSNGTVSNTILKLKKGEVLVFPSMMMHRINPVLEGERRALVAWAWGPSWK